MKTVIFALVGLVGLGGVCCGERVQRLDFVIDTPEGAESAWLFVNPDAIHPLHPMINASLFMSIAPYSAGNSQWAIDGNGSCERFTSFIRPTWELCGVSYANLPQYEFGPFADGGRKVGDAAERISQLTSSQISTSWRDSDGRQRSFRSDVPYLSVAYSGSETFDTPGDITHDGSVDASDASLLFSQWGLPDKYFGGLVVDAGAAGKLFAEWTGDVTSVPEPRSLATLGLLAIRCLRRWSSLSHRQT